MLMCQMLLLREHRRYFIAAGLVGGQYFRGVSEVRAGRDQEVWARDPSSGLEGGLVTAQPRQPDC
jgi:hypothetical protein